MFQGLANFVIKRHKLIVIFWLVLLVISLPATQLVADVVVYEETSMAPEDIESAKAAELISDQFPTSITNSTALVVVQTGNLFSSRLRDFSLQLEDEVRYGDIDYLDNFTSIYSIARDYLIGTVPLIHPLVSETEGQVNLSASLIFGGPAFYASSWGNDPVNESVFAISWNSYSMLVPNSSYLPLLSNYSTVFWQTWNETFNLGNGSAYLDPVLYNEFQRADEVVNLVALQSLGLLPPEDEMDLFMTGVWTSLNIFTWDMDEEIHNYSVALVGLYLGVQNITFLQDVLDLGPFPAAQTVYAFVQQVITSATLDTYPVAVPETVKSNLMNEETGIMIITMGFTRASNFRESNGTQPVLENVRTIKASIDELRTSLSLDQETILVTGDSALEADLSDKAWEDIERIDVVTIALVFILIGIFFLSIVAPMIPVGGIGIAVVISQGMIFLIGSYVAKIHFSVLTLTLTAMLGAGTDYAIFLMARYREERVRGRSKEDSVRESVTWAGESVTTSGVAVMISFGALSLGSFSFVRAMGLSIMMGIGLALIVAITLIPSLLMLLGDRIFWPGARKWYKNPEKEKGPGYFRKASTLAVKHSKAIVIAAILVSVPAAYGVFALETSFDFIAAMPETEATRGLDLLGEGFGEGKILPTYVVIYFESIFYDNGTFDRPVLDGIENLSQSLEALDNIETVTGPTRPQGQTVDYGNLSQMNQSQASVIMATMLQSVGEDNRTALLTIELGEEPFSRVSMQSISEIHDTILDSKRSDPNMERAEALVGGSTAGIRDTSIIFNRDFQVMAVVVIVGIFVLLLFVLGSVFLPIRLILTILLSITWTLAVTMVLFQVIIGIPVLWMMPLILFVIAMGLGMDYDIFLTTRIREEVAKGKTDKEAIVEAVEKTGGIITAAGAVMAGAFGSMMLSSLGMLQEFGFALFFVIVIDAMIVRIYLVPAIMVLLEKWNWWAPGRIQRVRREEKIKPKK
ncbi:MAG: MMPL family transporter [Thermoplasmata archaeon]